MVLTREEKVYIASVLRVYAEGGGEYTEEKCYRLADKILHEE